MMFKSAASGKGALCLSNGLADGQIGKRLKVISVLGMGILVGAALTIIIPESVLGRTQDPYPC